MRVRDSIGLNLSPFILRVMLAATFIWAGAGKFLASYAMPPESAAALANLGYITPPEIQPVVPEVAPDAGTPADTAPRYLPEQFPREGYQVRPLFGLAMGIHSAAYPGFDADGVDKMPLWPPALANARWPLHIAYAVSITELAGGLLLLLGLFSRLSALGIAVVMLGAIWLTQIGPAIQSGDTAFGFLPNHGPFDSDASGNSVWQLLLWQFSLFAAAAGVLFLGAGGLSLDRIIFGSGHRHARADASEKHD